MTKWKPDGWELFEGNCRQKTPSRWEALVCAQVGQNTQPRTKHKKKSTKYEKQKTKYWNQFNKMENALANYSSQSDYLYQMGY